MKKNKEMMLLSCLRNNSRETLTNMSKKTNIPISTIFDKLKEYEKKLISKHTSLIDFKKLGYDIKIHIMLKVNRECRQRFEKFLGNAQSVNTVYRINNKFDYFLEGIFKDICSYQKFADQLEDYGVTEMHEHFVIDELKKEEFLTNFSVFQQLP